MNKEESIKFLKQLYPNGGHCWLDYQRMEAIGMAIQALQEEPVNIWHDASVKPNIKEKGGIFVITASNGEYIGSRYYSRYDDTIIFGNYDKWAYLNDLANLSNVERTVKDRKEEPVSEELEDFAKRQAEGYYWGCKAGAKWKAENLWKPAEGDDLPEIDREVIAILDNCKVVFAHRPPEYWDGKNIDTGKVTRYYPKTYGDGGWNIPNIVYWLDVELPKEIGL